MDLTLKAQPESQTSLFASEIDTTGMTAKQKKNLRKKLYRKRKKMEQSQDNSQLDLTAQSIDTADQKDGDENDEEPDLEIDIDDVAIGTDMKKADKKEAAEKKKKTVSNSMERVDPDEVAAKLNGLLEDDNSDK